MTWLPTQPFLGFRLASVATADFLDALLKAAAGRERRVIGYLNAAQVNLAFTDPAHARALARLDGLYADGQAIVWAARWMAAPITERINAGDFTPEFCREAVRRGLTLALVGGRPAEGDRLSEADRTAAVFRRWTPDLNIIYTHHGYLDDPAAQAVGRAIEAADPDLVLVGMGAPRQEVRAMDWAGEGQARLWWCVGALFEYYAGSRRRAPVWVRRIGMEWVVRLALEPRRLWRRYILGNPAFIFRVLRRRPPRGLHPAGDREN